MKGKPEPGTCRLAVDIGGTFTDVVLETPEGRTTTKVLTTHGAPDEAVMRGVALVLDEAGKTPDDISILMHGTTLATNALIERKGAKTAFLTTEGFRDILEMGFEKRFAQYNLDAQRPAPLVPRTRRYTVAERVTAAGDILATLDEEGVRIAAKAMRADGVAAVAVGFMHAYAYPEHERRAVEILGQELPGVTVCRSSEVCPEMREYERFSTTTANAYVRPLMAGYLGRLEQNLQDAGFRCPTFVMMSGGGLTTLENACRVPIRLVESGPAGGAILAADIAMARNLDSVLAFDMGGTTAKICLIEDGKPDQNRTFEIAREYRDMKGSGLPVRIPVIEMVEIGAGGGSIARLDETDRIKVGPESAGSDPGPVAYGLGGTKPTVTDANLVLGKIDPKAFAGGKISLDEERSAAAIQQDIGIPLGLDGPWPAAGIAEIVEENMANAARVHAIERGKEASEYTMIAFGGGAPLHAAQLARKLGIGTVIVPVGAGVGSAIGFLRAPISYQVARSYRCQLGSTDLNTLNGLLSDMAEAATAIVRGGAEDQDIALERVVELRYLGQGHEHSASLPDHPLEASDLAALRIAFEALYERVYGLTMPDSEVECVSWSVTASTASSASPQVSATNATRRVEPRGVRPVYDAAMGGMADYSVYTRADLAPGDRFDGPAIIAEEETTTVAPSGFSVTVDAGRALVLESQSGEGRSHEQ